jgi:hypothetical protein
MRAKLEKINAEVEAELANVNNNYVMDIDNDNLYPQYYLDDLTLEYMDDNELEQVNIWTTMNWKRYCNIPFLNWQVHL